VLCGPDSSTITQSNFKTVQSREVGPTTAYFEFPQFISNTNCNFTSYEIYWEDRKDSSLNWTTSAVPGDMVKAFPFDVRSIRNYDLYITANLAGPVSENFGPFKLNLDCKNNIITPESLAEWEGATLTEVILSKN
jgi:hypothetical protein